MDTTLCSLAILSDGSVQTHALHALSKDNIQILSTVAEGTIPTAWVVASESPAFVDAAATNLRGRPATSGSLIYSFSRGKITDRPLTDGELPEHPSELIKRLSSFLERAQQCSPMLDEQDLETQILRYLWLRPGSALEPMPDWRHPKNYRYPILDALHGETDDRSERCLKSLERRQLLERLELKDRQRECDYCGSAHLSFTDICPNCRGIDIDLNSALHCFTCGLIAPEERFLQGDLRICPKCSNRLRHIGSDYDRPLETNACKTCDHVFVEGNVLARCMICLRASDPTSLRLSRIYSWRITDVGRQLLRGRAHAPALSRTHITTLDQLKHTASWLARLSAKQPGFGFRVYSIALTNAAQLRTTQGEHRTEMMMTAFMDRIHELLSDVDSMAAGPDDSLHLLVPESSPARLKELTTGIETVIKDTAQADDITPQWKLADVTDVEGGMNMGLALRARLAGTQHDQARSQVA